MKPQKNVPQAEHMPHVMPRARSSKSSGRVRQIKQRSEVQGCGLGCWCSGAVINAKHYYNVLEDYVLLCDLFHMVAF